MIEIRDVTAGKTYACRSVTASAKLVKRNRDQMRKKIGIAGLHGYLCSREEYEAIQEKLLELDGQDEAGIRESWRQLDLMKIEKKRNRRNKVD